MGPVGGDGACQEEMGPVRRRWGLQEEMGLSGGDGVLCRRRWGLSGGNGACQEEMGPVRRRWGLLGGDGACQEEMGPVRRRWGLSGGDGACQEEMGPVRRRWGLSGGDGACQVSVRVPPPPELPDMVNPQSPVQGTRGIEARVKGVRLRWWQPRHDGAGHDQWALDHVEVVLTRKQNYMMNFARQTGLRHYYSRKRRALPRQRA
ncbi:unnamed protein product [Coregonus sp. 'balchen']|nr:unnamed protein product [Coregonus sp. 'balchen']